MMQLNPKSLLDEYPGGVVGYDLQFVAGAKAAHTIIFEVGDHPTAKESYSVYVDVADDGTPVAISFVHHESAPISYSKCEPAQALALAEELFGFAQQLLEVDRIAKAVHNAQHTPMRDTMRTQTQKERRNNVNEAANRLATLERLERDHGRVFATA